MLANVEVTPRIGLGTLPVVTWSEPTAAQDHEDDWFGLHWKTGGITTWAAGRPFIWVDDEISERDREWVDANCRGPALLYRVDPSCGLAFQDVDGLKMWLARA